MQGIPTAFVRTLRPVKGSAYRPLRLRLDPAFTIPFTCGRDINADRIGTIRNMAQRDSEQQLMAVELDTVTAIVTRKLGEDGVFDDVDMQIIRGLRVLTFRQARQAEIADLAYSLNRIGMNERNERKIRDLFPQQFGGPDAA